MKDYSKVTAAEYLERKTEMLNSLGGKNGNCIEVKCSKCPLYLINNGKNCGCSELEHSYPLDAIRAVMEFTPPIDWSSVPVDAKLLVSDDGKNWERRHFAKYEYGKVCTFDDGNTSFTKMDEDCISDWPYAKLYKEGE